MRRTLNRLLYSKNILSFIIKLEYIRIVYIWSIITIDHCPLVRMLKFSSRRSTHETRSQHHNNERDVMHKTIGPLTVSKMLIDKTSHINSYNIVKSIII